jgi:hypothetical protein
MGHEPVAAALASDADAVQALEPNDGDDVDLEGSDPIDGKDDVLSESGAKEPRRYVAEDG